MNALAETAPVLPGAENLWARMTQVLRQEGREYALGWLERITPLAVRDGALVLGVPDRFYRDWVDDHYRALLESLLGQVTGELARVEYEVVPGAPPPLSTEPAPEVKSGGARPPRLNARFTFESFVVADSNQLAAAAAAAVADSPGRAYNPLYIYGGTGLGKTHLLHAIGNAVWERDNSRRVVYLSSEQFMNEYIESVREQRMPEFRRKFREECDVLLIDDIQVLGSMEETQREFFHTFNALHELGKAIILTSDVVPAEIRGLEERLRSRFSMGLITDIQEPSFETRVAILQKKAAQEGLELRDEVAHFIAKAVQKNVRELEGALVKVSAIHSLTKQPVTLEFAAHVLKDVLPTRQVVDVEGIQREVARYYKVPVEALKEDRRQKALAHARQVAMYLSRKLTKGSFPEIGARFNKDHSTVISAVRKVEKLRETDAGVKRELDELEAKLSGN
ncbi:MAG TPA: chromosomal replication initiator protein DnaA [Myxococcaceae bacterium]|nr:chromosomal replication initiator protein DnaA [Myxococcaceae bacterium]